MTFFAIDDTSMKTKKGINSVGVKENFINFVVGICHAESPVMGNMWVGADFYIYGAFTTLVCDYP